MLVAEQLLTYGFGSMLCLAPCRSRRWCSAPSATSTLLTKNSFLDEIKKSYVQTARMKGLSERRVLDGHVFRNAMLIVIAGFPGLLFVGAFFTGSLLIEQVFSLDGRGHLTYDLLIYVIIPSCSGTSMSSLSWASSVSRVPSAMCSAAISRRIPSATSSETRLAGTGCPSWAGPPLGRLA